MSLFYEIAYMLGITPWEQASETHGHLIAALLEREEKGKEPPLGRALDLGCGSGLWSVELAKRGWQVTGVDNVSKALSSARKRADSAGVDIRFVEGDVTALRDAGVGAGFRFFIDMGCFHGLNDKQRADMGREVTAIAAPDAVLLELAWTPARRGPLPRSTSREELESAFRGWTIVGEDPLDAEALPGFLKNSDPRCYKLRRIE